MSVLLLYADECVDIRIVTGLRRGGVDVLSVADLNLLGASDEVHQERAKALGRIVVTCDRDFLVLASRGELQMGLIFIKPQTSVGEAIRAIARIAETSNPEALAHRITWI